MRRFANTSSLPKSNRTLSLECWSSSAPPMVTGSVSAIVALTILPSSPLRYFRPIRRRRLKLSSSPPEVVELALSRRRRLFCRQQTPPLSPTFSASITFATGSIPEPTVFYGVHLGHVSVPGRRRGFKLLGSRTLSICSKPGNNLRTLSRRASR